MGFRDRDKNSARRKKQRVRRPRILVVSEGETTEPQYLKGYRAACTNASVDVEALGLGADPQSLVMEARNRKKQAEREARRTGDPTYLYDAVWCVFDVDDHSRNRFGAAHEMARDCGIELAVSNPSFELWLLLHFRESPGLKHRDDVSKLLRTGLRSLFGEKAAANSKHVDFARHYDESRVAVAESRAKRLDDEAEADGDAGRNPTTGVHRLTVMIRKGVDAA